MSAKGSRPREQPGAAPYDPQKDAARTLVGVLDGAPSLVPRGLALDGRYHIPTPRAMVVFIPVGSPD